MSLRLLFILFFPALLAMVLVNRDLSNAMSHSGIVSFEFCGYMQTCAAMLAAWGEQGQLLAMLSLGLNYLFTTLYVALIVTLLLRLAAAVKGAPGLRQVSRVMVVVAVAAGLADGVENYALICMLLEQNTELYDLIAANFAAIKFSLLALCLPWLLVMTVFWITQHRRQQQNS